MVHEHDLGIQMAFYLINSFSNDLNRAIVQHELLSSFEVPELFAYLFQ